MATTFKNALSPAIGTTNTIVYTAASNVKVTVIGISLTNITDTFVTASISVTDPAPTGTFQGTLVQNSYTISNVTTFSEVQTGATITGTGIPANTTISSFDTVAKTVTMNNQAASTQSTPITVTFSDTGPVSSYYVRNAIIPPNQSFRAVNGGERLVLGNGNTLSVVSSLASSLDVIVGLVEIV